MFVELGEMCGLYNQDSFYSTFYAILCILLFLSAILEILLYFLSSDLKLFLEDEEAASEEVEVRSWELELEQRRK